MLLQLRLMLAIIVWDCAALYSQQADAVLHLPSLEHQETLRLPGQNYLKAGFNRSHLAYLGRWGLKEQGKWQRREGAGQSGSADTSTARHIQYNLWPRQNSRCNDERLCVDWRKQGERQGRWGWRVWQGRQCWMSSLQTSYTGSHQRQWSNLKNWWSSL